MSQQITIREATGQFAGALKSAEYQSKFKAMLPSDISPDRFTNIVLLAVQKQPDLLKPSTDKTSLFLACQSAAKDGCVPDGKEGALVMYGNQVQWQIMIGGLRKRLANIGFDLRAEVVHANDTFDYDLGDDPRITHKPPQLGKDRGDIIGFYAIATGPDGRTYRDVMSKKDVDYVRATAKSGNIWQKWYVEMGKKTVGRRLVKSLPIATTDDRLREALEHDNQHFDPAGATTRQPSAAAHAVQAAARGQDATAEPADDAVIDGVYEHVDGADDDPLA